MKTLQEIKDLVAQEQHYPDWETMWMLMDIHYLKEYIDIVARNYARQAIEEQLKEVAKNARSENPLAVAIDKKSILNCTRINLL